MSLFVDIFLLLFKGSVIACSNVPHCFRKFCRCFRNGGGGDKLLFLTVSDFRISPKLNGQRDALTKMSSSN